MTEKQHPGISMHKLPIGGGFIGLLFALGSSLIFLLGLPALWSFVAFSTALGLGIAVVLRVVHEGANRGKPLSILSAPDLLAREKDGHESLPRRENRNLHRAVPRLSAV